MGIPFIWEVISVSSLSFGIQGSPHASGDASAPRCTSGADRLPAICSRNLSVYRSTDRTSETESESVSSTDHPSREARYGKLWEQGVEGIEKYNQINKVEPMARALKELDVKTWFSGLRREQSSTRGNLPVLAVQRGIFKFCR